MSTIKNNTTELQNILNTINNLPEAGGDPVLQDKTVTPTTSKQTITADGGYDGLDTVTVNAMPTATQATPSISINSSTGLITATATQTAGYVAAGTKSATKQLAFQAAQTITPGTTNKTIAANTYLGGVQTIKGDANLVASNIVSGKSIFGVVGTASVGGGGDTSAEDGLITRTLTSYSNDRVTKVGTCAFYSDIKLTTVNFPKAIDIYEYAFYGCSSLTSISFPQAEYIHTYAFRGCSKLTSINFPKAKYIYADAFYGCSSLTSISFPQAKYIYADAFYRCSKLTSISFPKAISISDYAFGYCTSLAKITLRASSVCELYHSRAFSNTGIGSNKGSIFVPTSLVSAYKSATNWAFFSARIFGI